VTLPAPHSGDIHKLQTTESIYDVHKDVDFMTKML